MSRKKPPTTQKPKAGVKVGVKEEGTREAPRANDELAAALWETGWYEAGMLTSFVDEPARVTPEQMDRWCRDVDS